MAPRAIERVHRLLVTVAYACAQMAPDAAEVKTIWAFWAQGWSATPPLVQACMRTWHATNPHWRVRLLDADTYSSAVSLADYKYLPPVTSAAFSDILRVELLRRYGGLWLDATVYVTRPLEECVEMQAEFFAFKFAGSSTNTTRALASWVMHARRSSYIVEALSNDTRIWWSQERPFASYHRFGAPEYFWLHSLFKLRLQDERFGKAWMGLERNEIIYGVGPLYFLPYEDKLFRRKISSWGLEQVISRGPCFKLTARGSQKLRTRSAALHLLKRSIDADGWRNNVLGRLGAVQRLLMYDDEPTHETTPFARLIGDAELTSTFVSSLRRVPTLLSLPFWYSCPLHLLLAPLPLTRACCAFVPCGSFLSAEVLENGQQPGR